MKRAKKVCEDFSSLRSGPHYQRFLRSREHTRPLGTRASERFVRGLVLVISARSLTNLSSTLQRILYIGAPGVGRKGTNMARKQGDKMEGKSEAN